MKSNYFVGLSGEFDFEEKDSYLDVWKDVLKYSSNLNGNWGVSMQVFYEKMVPAAQKDPAKFARWMHRLVKKSGLKIKSRAGFIRALLLLRKLKRKSNKSSIKKALFNLFEAGLNEPAYAKKALGEA